MSMFSNHTKLNDTQSLVDHVAGCASSKSRHQFEHLHQMSRYLFYLITQQLFVCNRNLNKNLTIEELFQNMQYNPP